MKPRDIDALLKLLDLEILKYVDDEVYAVCPAHFDRTGKFGSAGDWSIHTETGQHHCFSCGFGGSLLDLVQEALGVEHWEAIRWLVANDLWDIEATETWYPEDEIEQEAYVGESMLALFDEVPKKHLQFRQLTREACEVYGILWDGRMSSWILPIRTIEGKLLGYQRKRNKDVENVPPSMKKSHGVFGLHLWDEGPITLLESPLDCPRLWLAGIDGGVSSFGADVSRRQMRMILSVTDDIVLALDNDAAGVRSLNHLRANYGKARPLKSINYDRSEAKDIGDMETDEEICWAWDNARVLRNNKPVTYKMRTGF